MDRFQRDTTKTNQEDLKDAARLAASEIVQRIKNGRNTAEQVEDTLVSLILENAASDGSPKAAPRQFLPLLDAFGARLGITPNTSKETITRRIEAYFERRPANANLRGLILQAMLTGSSGREARALIGISRARIQAPKDSAGGHSLANIRVNSPRDS